MTVSAVDHVAPPSFDVANTYVIRLAAVRPAAPAVAIVVADVHDPVRRRVTFRKFDIAAAVGPGLLPHAAAGIVRVLGRPAGSAAAIGESHRAAVEDRRPSTHAELLAARVARSPR